MTIEPPGPPTVEARRTHPALEWWTRLRDPRRGDPGALARLRRSRSTLEAMQVPQAFDLARRLAKPSPDGQLPDWKVRAALDLARVLAHVREHEAKQHPMRAAGWKRFAGTRKESEAGEDRPRLAEARFRRLLQTGDGEEKVAAFTRLIALLDGRVKVDDLARDFVAWNHPTRGDRVRQRWAYLYFAAAVPPADEPGDPDSDIDPEDDR